MINIGESSRYTLFSQAVNDFLVEMNQSVKQFDDTYKQPTTKEEALDILFDKKCPIFEFLKLD